MKFIVRKSLIVTDGRFRFYNLLYSTNFERYYYREFEKLLYNKIFLALSTSFYKTYIVREIFELTDVKFLVYDLYFDEF